MKILFTFLLGAFLMYTVALAEEVICNQKITEHSKTDYLSRPESTYDIGNVLEEVDYLNFNFVKSVEQFELQLIDDLKNDKLPEHMPVGLMTSVNAPIFDGFTNRLLIITGVLLRYNLLYLREKAKNTYDQTIIQKYEKALKRFCSHVGETQFVD